MSTQFAEVSWGGRLLKVRAASVNGLTIVVLGKWLKTAVIKDETWLPAAAVGDADSLVAAVRRERLGADLFHFSQKEYGAQPAFDYFLEWQNVAAIRLGSYADWWEKLSQATRRNVRIAERRGVIIRQAPLDDQMIAGIVEINNEIPVRQGRRFWHYGKGFEAVKKDYSDMLERSEFLGAYCGNELVGILRLMDTGENAGIMQLLCKNAHFDKRPANALIAKAVELCAGRGKKYLTHHQYHYGNDTDSSLTEFKRRNGFEPFSFPSYYVPLTAKGRTALALNMHKGLKPLAPQWVKKTARGLRTRIYAKAMPAGGDNA